MTTNLHPNVREQLRDDACYLRTFHDEAKWWPIADRIVAILAEREQVERERDEALVTAERRVEGYEARLAKADKLAEDARNLLDYYQNPEADRSTDRLLNLEDELGRSLAAWESE